MDEDMEDGMVFSIGEDGTLTPYEEPYASIECKTEEDYNRFLKLIEIGENVEKLIEWLKSEKYLIDECLTTMTAMFEEEYKWKLSKNRIIDKTIKKIEEMIKE